MAKMNQIFEELNKMKVIFKIIITKEFKLTCSYKNKTNGNFTSVVSDVIPSILFNVNTIDICVEKEQAIHFLQQWFENPADYFTYSIHFQNKSYELLPEVLFAIIIYDYKKKVERNYIIETAEIQIPMNIPKIIQRIKISLDALGLKGIPLSTKKIDYDYSQQGEYLEELLIKKKEIDSFRFMITRAVKLEPNAQKEL